ncbi:hypothetical protein [Chroococcidiopsis sp. TS-821]|uniref:hypothetical protein n=1 Tax=Chroococcidiopsis sp. TS-821 TaxID=1378066 RepID=UPI00143DD5ED|nr:hypothetical protein [Chroococcidiopsis sp. TS-821]
MASRWLKAITNVPMWHMLLSHAEAEAARQAAQNKAERLAAKLRELGVDPDLV